MSKIVLTVDDSASVRQMVGYTLRNAGYEVREACDGRDALSKFDASVRLVITDLNMPNMDGLALVKSIRAGSSNKAVPIVVLTTESHEGKKQEGRSAGACAIHASEINRHNAKTAHVLMVVLLGLLLTDAPPPYTADRTRRGPGLQTATRWGLAAAHHRALA